MGLRFTYTNRWTRRLRSLDAVSLVTQRTRKQEQSCLSRLEQCFCATIHSRRTVSLTRAGDTQMVAQSTTSAIQRRLATSTTSAMSFWIKIALSGTRPKTREAHCATSTKISLQSISTKVQEEGSCRTHHQRTLPRVIIQPSLKVLRSWTRMVT